MKNSFFSLAMLAGLLAFCLCFTSCGPSAAEIAVRSAPSVEAVKGLKDKLIWLEGNAQSGGNYIIELDTDEEGWYCSGFLSCQLFYKDKSNVTITLRGVGENRTIRDGNIVRVGSGVTLILDDNITFQNTRVAVESGGTFVMNEGSTITGVRGEFDNGVSVWGRGTFIMKGGTISNNVCLPIKPKSGCANMKCSETMTVGKSRICSGGGVHVLSGGTLIKTGGTITGYASDPENGNAVIGLDGNAISGHGHAVFLGQTQEKIIDTTVGPETSLHFSNGVLSETTP